MWEKGFPQRSIGVGTLKQKSIQQNLTVPFPGVPSFYNQFHLSHKKSHRGSLSVSCILRCSLHLCNEKVTLVLQSQGFTLDCNFTMEHFKVPSEHIKALAPFLGHYSYCRHISTHVHSKIAVIRCHHQLWKGRSIKICIAGAGEHIHGI